MPKLNDGWGYNDRLICVNCKMAIIMSMELQNILVNEAMTGSTPQAIKYRLRNCPGEPWCELTDAEKQKLC